uniref:Ig-like domain-containing protein n=1 Tax=Cacopsylla melanoneura TaxID=428564 RepID=A0A8D8WKB8_9HEMI
MSQNCWRGLMVKSFLVLILCVRALSCIKLLELRIPSYKYKGDIALLECYFDLERDRLYSVIWYKDDEAFYTYKPGRPGVKPFKSTFSVDNVVVQKESSNSTQVLLKSLSVNNTGIYKCEVSAEKPSFSSVSGADSMVIVAVPKSPPRISGTAKVYHVGDDINLNCSSSPSHPPAKLRWFINDEEILPESEQLLPTRSDPFLKATWTELQFRAEPKHFRGGQIKIKCQATIMAAQGKMGSERYQSLPFKHSNSSFLLVQGSGSSVSSSLVTLLLSLCCILVKQNLF